MRKILLLTTLLFCIFSFNVTHAWQVEEDYQNPPPKYAKWGQLAVKETKNRYPDICIIDYLHLGREVGSEQSTEKFKLWLQACPSTREFGVFIDITFNNETEEIIEIRFQETDR